MIEGGQRRPRRRGEWSVLHLRHPSSTVDSNHCVQRRQRQRATSLTQNWRHLPHSPHSSGSGEDGQDGEREEKRTSSVQVPILDDLHG